MASQVQRRLEFPVRKSTRVKKTVETAENVDSFDAPSSTVRRSSRNLQRGYSTRQKAASSTEKGKCNQAIKMSQKEFSTKESAACTTEKKWSLSMKETSLFRQKDILDIRPVVHMTNECDNQLEIKSNLLVLKSPTKRKTASLLSPPTPPKSPCKSPQSAKECQMPSIESSKDTACYAVPNKWTIPSTPGKLPEHVSVLTPLKSPHLRSLQSPKKVSSKENEPYFTKSPKQTANRQVSLRRPKCQIYQTAKQALHTAKPNHLVGREQEVVEIKDFLSHLLHKKSAGSMYISGPPGTGKTATLLHIIDDLKMLYSCQIVYLNCMIVKDASSICQKLCAELNIATPIAGKINLKSMEKIMVSSKKNIIMILDEIDQLSSKHQEVLYHIFEWPSLPGSKVILLGVANALDLTDRILPRLQTKPQYRPMLLHFAPYTYEEITKIIDDRLSQSQNGDVIVEKSAVQFCARKVAAVAGDMRKALDVCRRAVEMAESEIRSQNVLKINDCNSPSKPKSPAVKKIGVGHISKVMSEVYGSSVQAQRSDEIPLQQKLAVCTLLLIIKNSKFKEVPLGKLYETYCKVCRRQQVAQVDQSEFHSVCVLLESRGIIGIKKAKETRLCKITLRQDEKELEQTLQDRVLVSTILKDGLPK
ncbi:cell division control protein 6 homolog [Pomacea canaliculata]|uniref:cell division control protein 6 homolog n=1 Tax=Pomacea canaliculata TaxID=400727 RepID=UPI000D73EEF8|nr:cell division control protein 6 homolog [Pomacea canaliculata]